MTKDIRQVRVGKHDFGIVGLTEAIERVEAESKDGTDDVIAEALFCILSENNYLPESAKDNYKEAFLREYQKHLGLAPTNQNPDNDELMITIVGQGCNRCDKLEMDVISLLSRHKIAARVEHVRDVKTIARMGIMGVPALMINGEVKCAGTAPSESQMLRWIEASKKMFKKISQ